MTQDRVRATNVVPYYDDGLISIYHGDFRDVLPEISGDVLVTDPPYGISHSSHREGSAPWKSQRSISGDESTAARDEVLAYGWKAALVFGSWRASAPADTRALLVWDKGDAGSGDLSLPWKPSHEFIYVIGDGFAGHRGPGVLRHHVCTHYTKGRLHPHAKPVALLRDLIAKCPDGTVVDPFMGSGPTLRAAKDLGRRAVGIEIEEQYCEITANRLSQEVLAI